MIFSFAARSVLLGAGIAQAVCTPDLLIDNYDNSTAGKLSSASCTFDDGTTADFKVIGAENKVVFKPIDNSSYVATDFPCFEATNGGFDALSLAIKAPTDNATITIELQTSDSCATSKYMEYFTNFTGLSTDMQTYLVPLDAFEGANLNAVQSIVYQDFTPGEWEIGVSYFSCKGAMHADSTVKLPAETPSEQLSNPSAETLA